MKPAFSVLFFTVCSGAGYGFLMWMLLMQLLHSVGDGKLIEAHQLLIGGFVGLVLVTLGLMSSTLHLANPKNAWRAFNRFKTSWLSREGVFAVLFYPVILAYAACLWLNDWAMSGLSAGLAILAIAIALATVFCTGMIYASLKPIRQWHNAWTTPIYLIFSMMSGALLMSVLHTALHGDVSKTMALSFVAFSLIGAVAKWAYFIKIGKPEGSTINTATGMSQAKVRLLDAGHSADTFLTNEFVFDVGAIKLVKLRRLMAVLTFVLPLVLVVTAAYSTTSPLIYVAAPLMLIGLFVERWLFFAEARHVVRLYHGDQRA